MTEMSKACLPPRQPHVSTRDRQHPLFPTYQQYRSSCSRLLIEASSFQDWLYQYEAHLRNIAVAADPRYPAFLEWMRVNKGGARRCPSGDFPHNFYFWIEGGRW